MWSPHAVSILEKHQLKGQKHTILSFRNSTISNSQKQPKKGLVLLHSIILSFFHFIILSFYCFIIFIHLTILASFVSSKDIWMTFKICQKIFLHATKLMALWNQTTPKGRLHSPFLPKKFTTSSFHCIVLWIPSPCSFPGISLFFKLQLDNRIVHE